MSTQQQQQQGTPRNDWQAPTARARFLHRETGTHTEGQTRTARGGRAQRNVGERLKGASSRGTLSAIMEIPWQSEVSLQRRGAYHDGNVHNRGTALTITGTCVQYSGSSSDCYALAAARGLTSIRRLIGASDGHSHTAQQRMTKPIRDGAY
jgi:hypothetical protein